MKTVQLEMKVCPKCRQLMLPAADQTSWFCPNCSEAPAAAAPARPRVSPPAPAGRRTVAPEPAPQAKKASPSSGPRAAPSAAPSALAAPLDLPLNAGQVETQDFAADQLLGTVLGGRYRLESVLGQGAMGVVYKAVQVALNKPYAVKVLLPSLTHDRQFEARFRQEAQIAAAVRHPGLVEVFDYGMEDGLAYYVMEFLEGQTLSELLGDGEALDAAEAVSIIAAAADAVGAAHGRGVVHRDLKPANLFLARDGAGREQVKVLDFGLSKAVASVLADSPPLTVNGSICGTPAYMSPEQAKGKGVDGRSDIYSLAVVLFRALTGKVPFDAAESLVVLYMHIDQPPPALDQCRPGIYVPAALEAALYRALAKRPEDRFRSMADFAEALRQSVSAGGAEDAPSGLGGPASHGRELPLALPAPRPSRPAVPAPSRGRITPNSRAPAPPAGWQSSPSRPPAPRGLSPSAQGIAPLAADSMISAPAPDLSPMPPGRPPAPSRPPPVRGPAPQGLAPLAPESMILAPGSISAAAGRDYPPAAPAAQPGARREKTLFIAAGAVIAVIALVAIALLVAGGQTPADTGPKGRAVKIDTTPSPATPAPTPGPNEGLIDERPLEDGPMPPSRYRGSNGSPPKPAPTAKPMPVPTEAIKPRPAPTPVAAKAKLVLTSKVKGRVVAAIGSQRVELSLNMARLLEVPAGRLRLSLAVVDAPGGECAVSLDLPEGHQESVVVGPEPGAVTRLGGAEGRAKLECR